MTRTLAYHEALREALDIALEDRRVFVMGLGVPDPKGLFGSTMGLVDKHGPERVLDMPTAENGMTGVALGACLTGMRPILTHQRIDFALLSLDQIVNQAAKWSYMFGGKGGGIPMVIRMIIGRGWGQGPQHAQSLQAWFAHVPGLKVVMPTTAYDAKGLLLAAVDDPDPVIVFEYRWLYSLTGEVPEGRYTVPIGEARIAREGKDVTVATMSYMTLEAIKAAEFLAPHGIDVEVLDLRSLRPLDRGAIVRSVQKTGRLVAFDTGWTDYGVAAEVIATVTDEAFSSLRAAPIRMGLPPAPSPSTPALANHYFPRAHDLVHAIAKMVGHAPFDVAPLIPTTPLDIPDPSFTGPF